MTYKEWFSEYVKHMNWTTEPATEKNAGAGVQPEPMGQIVWDAAHKEGRADAAQEIGRLDEQIQEWRLVSGLQVGDDTDGLLPKHLEADLAKREAETKRLREACSSLLIWRDFILPLSSACLEDHVKVHLECVVREARAALEAHD